MYEPENHSTLGIFGVVLKVVRQIFTATTQRTEEESKSHQTKDTSQDRVQSEVTVSIECEKGNVKTQQGDQAKWKRVNKEGKTNQELN